MTHTKEKPYQWTHSTTLKTFVPSFHTLKDLYVTRDYESNFVYFRQFYGYMITFKLKSQHQFPLSHKHFYVINKFTCSLIAIFFLDEPDIVWNL